jgi:hypothetical protein
VIVFLLSNVSRQSLHIRVDITSVHLATSASWESTTLSGVEVGMLAVAVAVFWSSC